MQSALHIGLSSPHSLILKIKRYSDKGPLSLLQGYHPIVKRQQNKVVLVSKPADIQRLNLSDEEKEVLQARIERLHKELNNNINKNQWLKPPKEGTPNLVKVDPSHLIESFPAGMEVGHVPIAVYQGMTKPPNCA